MALTELRIASRRSQLAMVQTNWVKAELEKAHPGLKITVEAMATPVSYTHLRAHET